jgi:hypothetical protein
MAILTKIEIHQSAKKVGINLISKDAVDDVIAQVTTHVKGGSHADAERVLESLMVKSKELLDHSRRKRLDKETVNLAAARL